MFFNTVLSWLSSQLNITTVIAVAGFCYISLHSDLHMGGEEKAVAIRHILCTRRGRYNVFQVWN